MTTYKKGSLWVCTFHRNPGFIIECLTNSDNYLNGVVISNPKDTMYEIGYKTNSWNKNHFKPAEFEYQPSQEGDREDDI